MTAFTLLRLYNDSSRYLSEFVLSNVLLFLFFLLTRWRFREWESSVAHDASSTSLLAVFLCELNLDWTCLTCYLMYFSLMSTM